MRRLRLISEGVWMNDGGRKQKENQVSVSCRDELFLELDMWTEKQYIDCDCYIP